LEALTHAQQTQKDCLALTKLQRKFATVLKPKSVELQNHKATALMLCPIQRVCILEFV